MEEAKRAASGLRLDLVLRQVASMQGVPQAVRELLGGPEAVDALWVPADPLVLGDETRRFVMQAAVQAGKPVYGSNAALVREGALVSNSPEIASIGQSVGELVNRIARGEKAGKLAVRRPAQRGGDQQEDRGPARPGHPRRGAEGRPAGVLVAPQTPQGAMRAGVDPMRATALAASPGGCPGRRANLRRRPWRDVPLATGAPGDRAGHGPGPG